MSVCPSVCLSVFLHLQWYNTGTIELPPSLMQWPRSGPWTGSVSVSWISTWSGIRWGSARISSLTHQLFSSDLSTDRPGGPGGVTLIFFFVHFNVCVLLNAVTRTPTYNHNTHTYIHTYTTAACPCAGTPLPPFCSDWLDIQIYTTGQPFAKDRMHSIKGKPNLKFLYIVVILLHVEWCIRQLWCFSIILYNITIISHNHHTNIYPLLTTSTCRFSPLGLSCSNATLIHKQHRDVEAKNHAYNAYLYYSQGERALLKRIADSEQSLSINNEEIEKLLIKYKYKYEGEDSTVLSNRN